MIEKYKHRIKACIFIGCNTVLFVLGSYFLFYGIKNWPRTSDACAITLICFFVILANLVIYNGKKYFKRIAQVLMIIGIIIFVLCEICIFSQYNCTDAYKTKPEYIIVLGSRLDDGEITGTLRNRLDQAIFLERQLKVPIIVSGGTTEDGPSEAELMRAYIASKDNQCKIIVEDKASNTKENFERIRDIVGEAAVVIITSDFHMFRSKLLAASTGFSTTYGLVSRVSGQDFLYYNLREVVAIVREICLLIVSHF